MGIKEIKKEIAVLKFEQKQIMAEIISIEDDQDLYDDLNDQWSHLEHVISDLYDQWEELEDA